jgi:hypothetical protein
VGRGREYDDATKAAVMAALLEGQSVRYVANQYQVPHGTVAHWAKTKETWIDPAVSPVSHEVQPESYKKGREIGALIVSLLETELEALKKIANAVTDPDWLLRQNAADVAVLAGVMQDKAFRKIEALSAAANHASQD